MEVVSPFEEMRMSGRTVVKVICNIENILNATNGKFYVYFTTIKTRRKCREEEGGKRERRGELREGEDT